MRISKFGQKLDANCEHEIFATSPFGFNVYIKYTADSPFGGSERWYHNVTEVHWRFTDIFNPTPSDRVAIESDIHATGSTRAIEYIDELHIYEAKDITEY